MKTLDLVKKKRAGRPQSRPRPARRVTPAVQARSQATEARLLAAADTLFARMAVADASVADIAREAGISVGTFYGRFADKDAFIAVFFERYLDDGRRRATELFASDEWPRHSVAAMARAFVTYRVRHYQRHRRLLYALVVHLRSQPGSEIRDTAARFAAHFHRLVTARFAAQGGADRWRTDARAVACGLTLVEAILKDFYLFGGGGLVAPRMSEPELIDRLTALFIDSLSRAG
jgi:AcrR family transcriptional regulator